MSWLIGRNQHLILIHTCLALSEAAHLKIFLRKKWHLSLSQGRNKFFFLILFSSKSLTKRSVGRQDGVLDLANIYLVADLGSGFKQKFQDTPNPQGCIFALEMACVCGKLEKLCGFRFSGVR